MNVLHRSTSFCLSLALSHLYLIFIFLPRLLTSSYQTTTPLSPPSQLNDSEALSPTDFNALRYPEEDFGFHFSYICISTSSVILNSILMNHILPLNYHMDPRSKQPTTTATCQSPCIVPSPHSVQLFPPPNFFALSVAETAFINLPRLSPRLYLLLGDCALSSCASQGCLGDRVGDHRLAVMGTLDVQRNKVNFSSGRTFLSSFRYGLKETLLPDDPFRYLKGKSACSVAWGYLKYFVPILEWAPRYTFAKFRFDLLAGITIASVAIPQGISYARLANLPPIIGLCN